jgi:hypothetical protein
MYKQDYLSYRIEYTFNGTVYAPLMYKVIMHLATIDSITTIQTLHNNLQLWEVYAETVYGDMYVCMYVCMNSTSSRGGLP